MFLMLGFPIYSFWDERSTSERRMASDWFCVQRCGQGTGVRTKSTPKRMQRPPVSGPSLHSKTALI